MLSLATAFMLLSGCASTQVSKELASSQFNGTWIGKSEDVNGPNLYKRKSNGATQFKFEIKGGQGFISYKKGVRWVRMWENLANLGGIPFNVVPADTNAVVFQTTSGHDSNCLWVETWTFNLTKTGGDAAKAYFYRTVNNRECTSRDDGIWTVAGSISLKRVE